MEKTILVVEDDAGIRVVLQDALTSQGYNVETAEDGRKGLEMAKQLKPDLIILDVMLPGLDGFEICSQLRAEEITATMPIIMLSAKGQETDKTTGLSVGANEYLTKPVDRALLLEKITSLLAEG